MPFSSASKKLAEDASYPRCEDAVADGNLDSYFYSGIQTPSTSSGDLDLEAGVAFSFSKCSVSDVASDCGALREGGACNLWSKEYIGVLAHYGTVGLVDAALQAVMYPFLQNYLNASGALVVTATMLTQLPWSFEVFYGILSDCCPILGYRRRPYMILGWTLAVVMLFGMGSMHVGQPYWADPNDANINPEADPAAYAVAMANANQQAPNSAVKYVLLMMLCVCGYVLSDVCADGLVVEVAQREPEAVRGHSMSIVYSMRTAFNIVGQLIVGFAFNGKHYGGSFSFSLSFPTLMLILALVACPVLPTIWCCVHEDKCKPTGFRTYMVELWKLFKSRVGYHALFFFFFGNMLSGVSYTAQSPVQLYMIGVTSFNNSLSTAFSSFCYLVGLLITGKWGLHWSWRSVTMASGLIVAVVVCGDVMISVWDIYRSQWFWLVLPAAVNMFNAISFLMSNFVVVELAGNGNECAVFGLFSTVYAMANPFAATLTKIIDAGWNLTNERIMGDSHGVRVDISYAILVMFLTSVAGWSLVFALPRQKKHAQHLKLHGGSNALLGGLTVAYVLLAFVWSLAANLMSIFPSTSCLIIAGGTGCN